MEGGDLRMTSIDERVVQMKFDNAAFGRGVDSTLKQLDALNKALQLQGGTKGLTDVAAASQKVDLNPLQQNVDFLAGKFKAMGVIATTALVTVAHTAVSTGADLIKSLTLDPILKGFQEYEINMNSIQTILANTAHAGTSLDQVNEALQKLNEYSDQTIYNFAEMAKNIGTFTAAGVDLDSATEAIKGIANLAAVSGSNSQQASAAMYQLSQAISAGRVTLEDWNSVVNAGMGGKVFQDSLMETARVHGVAIDQMVKDAGSFRLTLQEGWLTGEILTETLSKFTGDLNAAQLKTMGYNEEQIAGILKMGEIAQNAATEVKTMSQLISTLQEAAGSGWSKTWAIIFGDFEEAKTLFTDVNNVLGAFINTSSDARNKVLEDWKALGGRTVIIEAVSNAFNALMSIIKPVGQAFKDIFPPVTGQQLYELSVTIRDFTEGLTLGSEASENLRRTFAGAFAVLEIGWEIIKQVVKTLFELVGVASDSSGGFLEFTGSIGDFLVAVNKALIDGEGLEKVFDAIRVALTAPIRMVQELAGFLGELFDTVNNNVSTDAIGEFAESLEPLGPLGELISTVWDKALSILGAIATTMANLARNAASSLGEFGSTIAELVQTLDFSQVLAGLNTGLLAAFLLSLRSMFGGGGDSIFEQISDTISSFTDTLATMQNTLRAATLLQIAIAVGILAVAMNTLAKIDAAGLTRASVAIATMFTQLIAALLIFEKFSGFVGFAKMPFVAASMILMAAAVNVLADAVTKLAVLDWNGLAKGLTGTTVLMGALVAVGQFMPNPAGMISTGLGMIALAAAVKILVSAVTDLSGISWEDLAKGLVGVGSLLGALGLFVKFAGVEKGGILQGAGLILLAAGIKILASAVGDFAQLSWGEIARGLTALAGGLTILTAALMLIPPTAPLGAAAILITSLSLGQVADALEQMGQMSWGEIGKGLTAMLGALTIITAAVTLIPPTAPLGAAAVLIVAMSLGQVADVLGRLGAMDWQSIGKSLAALAGALTIIATAVIFMTGAVSGAAAVLVVSAALAILAPVLLAFGGMSWEEIGKGLLVLAASLTILGIAGALLTPVIPTLIGLGVAVTLLGAGMALAGVGVLAFSVALTALAVSGAAGTAAIVGIVAGLVGLLPMVVEQIGLAVVAFARVIAEAGPAILEAITTVLMSLIGAINTLAPEIVDTLLNLLTLMLETLNKYVPRMVDAGLKLLIGLLDGIAKNIGKVVSKATDVAVAFIKGIADNNGRVQQAGADMIIGYVNTLADTIRKNQSRMNAAGRNLASAIVEGMVSGLTSGVSWVTNAAMNVARSALNAAKDILGINSPSKEFQEVGEFSGQGMALGLENSAKAVEDASAEVGKTALSTMSKTLEDVSKMSISSIDTQPVIRPVLDLTNIERTAPGISNLIPKMTLSVDGAYSQASVVSQAIAAGQDDEDGNSGVPGVGGITFNQYNTSPKALSTAEIYRNTKNQISKAKEVVSAS
jgi:tape measure domain-containing protein